MDDWLSTGDVAEILGVSRQHVVDLCDRGDLPCTRFGSHRRIRRSDLTESRIAEADPRPGEVPVAAPGSARGTHGEP